MTSAVRLSLWAAGLIAYMTFLSVAGADAAKLPGNVKSPEAVGQVLSGQLKTANATWWGFDAIDAADAVQSAVNSGAKKVIIPNMGQDWIVRPIQFPERLVGVLSGIGVALVVRW